MTDLAGEEVVDALSDEGLALDGLAVDLSGLLLAESESLLGLLGEEVVVRLLNLLGLGGILLGGSVGVIESGTLGSGVVGSSPSSVGLGRGSGSSLLGLGIVLTLNLGCLSAYTQPTVLKTID
jgi:hypothetical protein